MIDDKSIDKTMGDIALELGVSKYLMVNMVAKRMREIFRGSKPLVERLGEDEETEMLVLREFRTGHLKIVPKKPADKLVDIANRDE